MHQNQIETNLQALVTECCSYLGRHSEQQTLSRPLDNETIKKLNVSLWSQARFWEKWPSVTSDELAPKPEGSAAPKKL